MLQKKKKTKTKQKKQKQVMCETLRPLVIVDVNFERLLEG